MALYRLLKQFAFEPEQLHVLARAYEGVLIDLKLESRDNSTTEMIAKRILDYAQRGEMDAIRLRQIVREESGRGGEDSRYRGSKAGSAVQGAARVTFG